ncbi:amidohydrolase family protein [Paenibacillus sp. GCM10023248]|uniref:amidohydrolase family protein n=1 Tax=Bacillales TaxID=1385 RepID=UPI002379DEE7|nr:MULTISPECIES: amidohydrolase family protein [Bacillales]MDD9269316.1 amidohydrolase family protein [Paenibacillus sp. MAHUQ-63]MDR6880460.1 cytosine deaminase [Bacillus sp. 3255]
MLDMIVRKARILDDPENRGVVDVGVKDGRIAVIGQVDDQAEREIDASGHVLLPPFVESHIHLDTVLTAGEPAWNESGTLFEGIRLWQKRKAMLTHEDVLRRAEQVLRQLMAAGVLHVRTQTDISDPHLTALRALLDLRERMKPHMHVQVIAFPQDGIRACPDNERRLEQALALGADGVGAVPHLEPTREEGLASLDIVFQLAEKHGGFVHIFCDETDDAGSTFLESTAHLAIRYGLRERVTAAHANATAYYGEAYFQKVLALTARSGIHIVCCPLINSAMQGRYDAYPRGRGIARIKELRAAGVNVSLAHDDIQTPFYPLGTGNLLSAAHMAAHLAHMTGREEVAALVRMVTSGAAKVLQLRDYGLAPGLPASFVLLPGRDAFDLVREQPLSRYVVSHGRIAAETEPARTLVYDL